MSGRLLLRGGIIVDGTGAAPFRGDLAVSDGRITWIRRDGMPRSERGCLADAEVIDVRGQYIAPGFIDCHSHSDLQHLVPGGLAPKLLQGVTTEVVGQCGLSVFPLPSSRQAGWRRQSVIGTVPGDWGWESAASWFSELRAAGLECNLVPFVGLGTVRYGIAGDRSGPLDPEELAIMAARLEEAFTAGAAGLSFGLIYMPAFFSTRGELLLAARVAARCGRPLAVHLRSESDELLEAVREMVHLAEESGVELHLSHLKAIGERNSGQLDDVFSLIEEKDLLFDHYPYPGGSTTLLSLLPPDLFTDAGVSGALMTLRVPAVRDRLERLYEGTEAAPAGLPWDNLPLLLGWKNIRIVSVGNAHDRHAVGSSLDELSRREGRSPAEVMFSLLENSAGDVRMIDTYMSEETLEKILLHPRGCIASDSLFGGHPHPRLYGCFPRIFSNYVFGEKKLIPVETAVRKMTGLPASWLGLRDRGALAAGKAADIAVFGTGFRHTGDENRPDAPVEGLRLLILNGDIIVRDDQLTGDGRCGRLIAKGEKFLR